VGTGKKRLILAVGFALVVVITAFGVYQVLPDKNEPAKVATEIERPLTATGLVNQFLDLLSAGDPRAAAALTDDPQAATTLLADVWLTLRPTSLTTTRTELVEPTNGVTEINEPFGVTWDLGQGRTWSYASALHVVHGKEGWVIRWAPTIVHPRLRAGQALALRDLTGKPAVLDRDGAALLTWSPTGPTATKPPSAPVLGPALGRVAAERAGAKGWYVALVTMAGGKVGKEVGVLHGGGVKPLATTLSRAVQQAAQSAVDSERHSAMMVVIQPSSGDLLAVAQNASTGPRPTALSGLYPPGSTFKIATAAALIEAGDADVGTIVPCPGSVTVRERTIDNADFALGDVPLRTAFAESCNTTFAIRADGLSSDALPEAAGELGLNADFEIPGIVTELGAVRPSANPAEQVENSIGQGTVQVSCLGLAVMAATVAEGRPMTPRLWRDLRTKVVAGYEVPSDSVLESLRTLMREVVTSGRGSALAGYGDVHGKTGTAEVPGSAHGWFVGYRGDLAFATLVIDASASSLAVEVTGRFLREVG
jgi:Penicillin binding protein transpeptidase domain/NTF2-like N-terminal transpeptidase domain